MNSKTKVIRLALGLVLVGLLAGCVSPDGSPDRTGTGALIGGASGAAIGAIADRHNPGAGALIGGALGAITGGLVGHSMDQEAQPRRQVVAVPVSPPPPPPTPPPSLDDIKKMSQAGVSDDAVIGQINAARAVYHLDANAIVDLNRAGVSQKVITHMISTANSTPTPVTVTQAPPPAPVETVVVTPGPDYVWAGGEWVWEGGAWVWVGGRWVLPPHHHAIWIEARWEYGPYGWHRVPGHWR